jgi:hypothetical protein
VTVSVTVRATVVLVDVSVLATFSVNALAVDVSIVTPALALVIVKVFEPVPWLADTFEITPETPCVTVTVSRPELVAINRGPVAL